MCLACEIKVPSLVKIPRVKSYTKSQKQNSWMAKGPGRRHSQTTHAAKLRRNSAKQSRVVIIIIIIMDDDDDNDLKGTEVANLT